MLMTDVGDDICLSTRLRSLFRHQHRQFINIIVVPNYTKGKFFYTFDKFFFRLIPFYFTKKDFITDSSNSNYFLDSDRKRKVTFETNLEITKNKIFENSSYED